MLEWSLVSQVEASPHDAGTAYLAINRYKLDDYRPYIYVTRDYGKTWRKITKGMPEEAFVRVVREDPARRGLLYAGTETGVHVSFDGGEQWQSLQLNLPAVPVTDLVLKDHDVVVSTQGRGFWILDDVTPLHQLDEEAARGEIHLFRPRAVPLFFGQDRPRPNLGQNPPAGLTVYYSLQRAAVENEEVILEFLDAGGRLVRRFSSLQEEPSGPDYLVKFYGAPATARKLPAKPGLNRFVWDLRFPQPTWFEGMILSGSWPRGPRVVPGTYQVRLTAAGRTMTQPFEVTKSPQLSTTQVDYQKRFGLLMRIRDKVTETHEAIARIRQFRAQVEAIARSFELEKGLSDEARDLIVGFTSVEKALYQTKNESRQDTLNFPIRLHNKLTALAGVVESAEAAPTDQSYEVYGAIAGQIDEQLAILKVLTARLSALKQRVRGCMLELGREAADVRSAANGNARSLRPLRSRRAGGRADGFLLRLERYDEAVAELRRAQELDPLSLHVNYDFGWHLYRSRQYDRAIEQMKKAVELDPHVSWAHHALGEMCAEKGLFEEAVRHMRHAMVLSPDIPHYLSAMGYILGRAGRPDEARHLLDNLSGLPALATSRLTKWPSCTRGSERTTTPSPGSTEPSRSATPGSRFFGSRPSSTESGMTRALRTWSVASVPWLGSVQPIARILTWGVSDANSCPGLGSRGCRRFVAADRT